MTTDISTKEKKIVAASYVFTFYQSVTIAIDYEAQYRNILVELNVKYSNQEVINKLNETEKEALIQSVQLVRFYSRKCWIMYKTLIKPLGIKEDKGLEEAYIKIKDQYVINQDDLENFIIAINQILIDNTIKDLIDNSQNLLEAISSENA